MKIVFTGGGTAGHIYPLISIVREIRKTHSEQNIDFFYVGPKDDFIFKLLKNEGISAKIILGGKLRRYFSFKNIIDVIFKFPIGFLQAFYNIFVISPDAVFSKGGYGSVPVVLAAWILRTPVFLHESDSAPGLANRICGKFALEIFTSFPVEKTTKLPINKMVAVGNPTREEILKGSKEEAVKIFNLSGKKPIILIIGGSQGALRINQVVLLILHDLLKEFEVIHQTGDRNFKEVQAESNAVISSGLKSYYHPFPFLQEKELACAFKAADLIISRAGAGTIFEIALLGKPSILFPLEGSAQNHQLLNAYAFAENGSAIVLEEENFKPHFLLEQLRRLIQDPDRLKRMGVKAKEFSKPNASRIIAEYLISYLFQ